MVLRSVRRKKLQGEVVSNRMNKTVVVKVALQKKHPKYHKRYVVHKKYKVHDQANQYKIGDLVEIEAARPYSKAKHWEVARKVK